MAKAATKKPRKRVKAKTDTQVEIPTPIAPEQPAPPQPSPVEKVLANVIDTLGTVTDQLCPGEPATIFAMSWVGKKVYFSSNVTTPVLVHALSQVQGVVAKAGGMENMVNRSQAFAWVSAGQIHPETLASTYEACLNRSAEVFLGERDVSMPPAEALEAIQTQMRGTILPVALTLDLT